MAELKRYTSFKELKSDRKSGNSDQPIFSEFEAFLKRLQSEYDKKANARSKDITDLEQLNINRKEGKDS